MIDITKPTDQKNQVTNNFSWEQFAKDCVFNKYILVIGGEAVLDKDKCEIYNGNSTELLLDQTLLKMAESEVEEGDDSIGDDVNGEYEHLKRKYKTFSSLVRKFNKYNVKTITRNVVKSQHFLSFQSCVETTLVDLLQTKCFRVVLTTTIDPFIELTMIKIWGEGGFDVVDISNVKENFKFRNCEEFDEVRPVLCYVFGKVDPDKQSAMNSFVLSENDAMEKISKWFENNNDNKFLKFIRGFRLLSIGNQFDDWMFRFFWFLLRGKVNSEADGQVAVEIKEDKALTKYMKLENVELFQDARSFMQKANIKIKDALDISNNYRRGDAVFISYAHEDKYIAIPLFERLSKEGIGVWIDEQGLEPGDKYERILIEKINRCRVFMPILSSSIRRQIDSKELINRWYYKEWQHAQKRYLDLKKIAKEDNSGFTIIPFVVGDFGVDLKTCECIDSATKFEISKSTIDYLVTRIKKEFGDEK